jgi:hypothetical protein
MLALKGLRFYKQRFVSEWGILGVKPVEHDFLNSIESEDELWDEEEQPIPTDDDMQTIRNDIQAAIQEKSIKLLSDLEQLDCSYKERRSMITALQSRLEMMTTKLGDASLDTLNRFHEQLEDLHV